MTKTELRNHISEVNGITKKQAGAEIERVFGGVESALAKGESVNVTGYANFKNIEVPAQERRNPSTGETFMADATRTVRVSSGAKLKAAVK